LKPALRLLVSDLGCSRGERRLFAGLSFTVASGEALVITGPNGSGKTTLLRIIAGFTPPEAGSIRLEGGPDDRTLPQALHFVGHRDGLKGALMVRENLAIAPVLLGQQGMPVADAAAHLDLTRLLDLPVSVLSAGQRRRTALARLLAAERPLWLLDEPTAALDTRSQELVVALLENHVRAGGMVIAATHLPLGLTSAELRFEADGSHVIEGLAR
jgi:heme exporter protein A